MTKLLPLNKRIPNILIIGDVCLDKYNYGQVYGIAPESPLPVLKVERVEYRLGMAANVAKHLKTLGSDVTLVFASQWDLNFETLHELLYDNGIDYQLANDERQLTIKERGVVVASSNNVYISRNDYEDTHPLDFKLLESTLNKINLKSYDAIVLSDYGKGVIGYPQELLTYLKSKTNAKIFVDPDKFKNSKDYKGTYCIKANEKEAVAITREKDLENSVLCLGLECDFPIITLGDKGCIFIASHKSVKETVPAIKVKTSDVIGCGDSFISSLVYNICKGHSELKSLRLATKAAAKNVQKFGT